MSDFDLDHHSFPNGDITLVIRELSTRQAIDVDDRDVMELLDALAGWITARAFVPMQLAVSWDEREGDGGPEYGEMSLVCPRCNGVDTIVARDLLITDRHCYSVEPSLDAGKMRAATLLRAGLDRGNEAPVTVRFGEAHGDEETLSYVCADHQGGCGAPLSMPDYMRELY